MSDSSFPWDALVAKYGTSYLQSIGTPPPAPASTPQPVSTPKPTSGLIPGKSIPYSVGIIGADTRTSFEKAGGSGSPSQTNPITLGDRQWVSPYASIGAPAVETPITGTKNYFVDQNAGGGEFRGSSPTYGLGLVIGAEKSYLESNKRNINANNEWTGTPSDLNTYNEVVRKTQSDVGIYNKNIDTELEAYKGYATQENLAAEQKRISDFYNNEQQPVQLGSFNGLKVTRLSKNINDIKSQPGNETIFTKGNDWFENIPVVGPVGSMLGISKIFDTAYPTPLVDTSGWSTGNIQRFFASDVKLTGTPQPDKSYSITPEELSKQGGIYYNPKFIDSSGNKTSTMDFGDTTVDLNKPITMTHVQWDSKVLGSSYQNLQRDIKETSYGKVLSDYHAKDTDHPAVQFFGGAYQAALDNPITLPLEIGAAAATMYGLGAGTSALLGGIDTLSTAEIPVLSRGAQALLTPTALGLGSLAQTGMVGLFVYESGKSILEQPTYETKGAAATHVGAALFGLYAGSGLAEPYSPKSDYYSKTLSGEYKLPFTTQARNYLITKGEKYFSSSPQAFDKISEVWRKERYTQPQPGIIQVENPTGELSYTGLRGYSAPDLSEVSTIGPERAPVINQALFDSDVVIKGSAGVRGQVSGLESGKIAGRMPVDVDILAPDMETLNTNLKMRGETAIGIDIKSPEPGYPDIFKSKTGEGSSNIQSYRTILMNRIFGTPVRELSGEKLPLPPEVHIEGEIYRGDIYSGLSEEQMNVQFSRKVQAMQEDLIPGNKEQYRLIKDSFDAQAQGRDLIFSNQAKSGIKVGTSTRSLDLLNSMREDTIKFDFIPNKDIPILNAKTGVRYQATKTYGELWDAFDKSDAKTQKIFERPEVPETKESIAKSQGSISPVISSGGAGILTLKIRPNSVTSKSSPLSHILSRSSPIKSSESIISQSSYSLNKISSSSPIKSSESIISQSSYSLNKISSSSSIISRDSSSPSNLFSSPYSSLYKLPSSNPFSSPSTSPGKSPSSNPFSSPSGSSLISPSSSPYSSPSTSPGKSPSSNPYKSPSSNPFSSPSGSPSTVTPVLPILGGISGAGGILSLTRNKRNIFTELRKVGTGRTMFSGKNIFGKEISKKRKKMLL
jgi:hypothetical protein